MVVAAVAAAVVVVVALVVDGVRRFLRWRRQLLWRISRKLILSYALIHPAISAEELAVLNAVGSGLPIIQTAVTASTSTSGSCRQNGYVDSESHHQMALFPSDDNSAGFPITNGGGGDGYGMSPRRQQQQIQTTGNWPPMNHVVEPLPSSSAGESGTVPDTSSGVLSGTRLPLHRVPSATMIVQSGESCSGNAILGSGGTTQTQLSSTYGAAVAAGKSTDSSPGGVRQHAPLHLSKSAGFLPSSSNRQGQLKTSYYICVFHITVYVV